MLRVLHYLTDISYMEALKAVCDCWAVYLLVLRWGLGRNLDYCPCPYQNSNDYEILIVRHNSLGN